MAGFFNQQLLIVSKAGSSGSAFCFQDNLDPEIEE
jgi:hypothetical protein